MAVPPFIKPLPRIARGIVKAPKAGWHRALYYDAVTGEGIVFDETPSVVALSPTRRGKIETVKIEIPVKVPVITIPYINESFPYFTSDLAWVREQLCKPLNRQTASLYRAQSRINDVIERINDGFRKVNDSVADLRDKSEGALNKIIPAFYSMLGLPKDQLMSFVNTRNIRKDWFEFYAFKRDMVVHYVAVGKKMPP